MAIQWDDPMRYRDQYEYEKAMYEEQMRSQQMNQYNSLANMGLQQAVAPKPVTNPEPNPVLLLLE